MTKLLKRLFSAFVTVMAVTSTVQATPVLPPPDIAAKAYLVMDAETGHVLMGSRAHDRFAPASLTKMMTAYIAEFEMGKGIVSPDDQVPISVKAWKTDGSRMFVREGTEVKLMDLLHGIIIHSGNDASVALAEYLAGSEGAFADLMNQHAKRLGMSNTHFVNSTGLPAADHYSSPHDLAILARAIIKDFPDNYGIYSKKYFEYNGIKQPNRNKLLWSDDSVDGLKTGYTKEAGYCLVASAKRKDLRLITVVLGANSVKGRIQESQKLLAYAYRVYEHQTLYRSGEVLNTQPVWFGTESSIQLGVNQDVGITLPRGQKELLSARLVVEGDLKAPIRAGQELGHVEVTLEDKVVESVPLVALAEVDEAGILKRIWHALLLFFSSVFG